MLASVCSANSGPKIEPGYIAAVDLLAIGNQRVTRERQVVLPAGELSNPSNRAIDGAQARAVTLAPDHALMIGRRDLAAALDQRAVRIEQKLRIVDRATVALIDTDRDDHARVLRGFADRAGLGGWDGDRLFQQALMLLAHRVRGLDEGEVGVVGNDSLRESREPDTLFAQLADLLLDLLDRALPAVQHRADLHGGGFDDRAHRISLSGRIPAMTGLRPRCM